MKRFAAVLALQGAFATAAATEVVYAQAFFSAAEPDAVSIVTSSSPLPPSSGLLASAFFNDSMLLTGWSRLDVSVPVGVANESLASYAAGKLEGLITAPSIARFTQNNFPQWPIAQPLYNYLSTNLQWARQMANENAATDPLWHQMSLLLAQLDGQYQGYLQAVQQSKADNGLSSLPSLDFIQIYQNIAMGDLDVLGPLFGGDDDDNVKRDASSDGHCSILVKLLRDPATGAALDIIAGHTTWSSFESMDRTWKVYDLPFTVLPSSGSPIVPGRVTSLSSYPGMLGFSDDDFYQIPSTMLWVSETTIDNRNSSLFQYVTAEGTLLDSVRNIIANRLATNGSEWSSVFLRFNSGTYNNQQHVLDWKLFKPGMKSLPAGLLTITEQVPGPFSKSHDVTPLLEERSYWSSYNRIFDPQLFVLTNQTAAVSLWGDHFSYNLTARAQIFAREESKVVDLASFQALLRYNSFQTDPMGTQGCQGGDRSASNAIAERGDLTPAGARCIDDIVQQDEAATDCKITSFKLMQAGQAWAISGPTTYNGQPTFCWSNTTISAPHAGLPDCYDFPWVLQEVAGPMK